MKNSEIRELTTKEVGERLEIEEANMVKMKLNHAISPMDNPMKINHSRKVIARLKTELNSREIQNIQ